MSKFRKEQFIRYINSDPLDILIKKEKINVKKQIKKINEYVDMLIKDLTQNREALTQDKLDYLLTYLTLKGLVDN